MKTNRRGFLGLLGAGAASLGVLKAGDSVANARVAGPVANAAKVVRGGKVRMDKMGKFSYKALDDVLTDVLTRKDMSWLGVSNWLGLMYGKHEIDMEGTNYERQLIKFEFMDGGGMGNTETVYFPTFQKFATITGLGIFDERVGGHLLYTTELPWRNGRLAGPGDNACVKKHDLNVKLS